MSETIKYPWAAHWTAMVSDYGKWRVVSDNDETIADGLSEANAHILAAAPDMLHAATEAADFLSAAFENYSNGEWENKEAGSIAKVLDKAICKAKGAQS